jgi:hypothetical protein
MITNPPTTQNWGTKKTLCGDHGNPAIIAKEVISTRPIDSQEYSMS